MRLPQRLPIPPPLHLQTLGAVCKRVFNSPLQRLTLFFANKIGVTKMY